MCTLETFWHLWYELQKNGKAYTSIIDGATNTGNWLRVVKDKRGDTLNGIFESANGIACNLVQTHHTFASQLRGQLVVPGLGIKSSSWEPLGSSHDHLLVDFEWKIVRCKRDFSCQLRITGSTINLLNLTGRWNEVKRLREIRIQSIHSWCTSISHHRRVKEVRAGAVSV